jgi:hypothetical protein
MANTLEVEGKEILIKSSKGLMAVIPKDKVSWVKGQIESGNHGVVDKYVNSLSEYKYDNQKAGNGLYANIHAKRERIAAGSGERMRKPGEAGAPTAGQFKQAAKTAKAENGMMIKPPMKAIEKNVTRVSVQQPFMDKPKVVEKETMRMFPVGPLVPFNYYQERKKKEKQKAEEGMRIDPPTKAMAESSTTQVRMPVKPELNIGGQIVQPQAPPPNLVDLVKKTWNRYSNNGKDRTLLEVASNFVPYYEQFVDAKDIVTGIMDRDKERINSGALGMIAPVAGKALLSGQDYLAEKFLGKQEADKMAKRRNAILNMSESELSTLYQKYGNGGYEKWEAAGFPSLSKK